MPRKKKTVSNFEASLDEIGQLVELMEAGELSLEDSLKTFERGISLTRECQTVLKDAEQKVKILIKKDNEHELEDYECDDLFDEDSEDNDIEDPIP